MDKEKDEELKYERAIKQLAMDKSPLIFDNSGVTHASAVVSTIFANASKEVCIYAQNMNGEISKNGNYFDTLSDFLVSGKKLRVLVDAEPAEESEAFNLIKLFSSFANGVSLRLASEEFKTAVKKTYVESKLYHFCIGDNRMFRIEIDPIEHKAVCSFNNEDHSKKLKAIFDTYFDKCPSIS